MKTKIIIGSLLIILLLTIVPSIPAVQYKTVKDINKNIMDKIKNADIGALKSIDLSVIKKKVNDFFTSKQATPYVNVFYIVAFLLTLTYQIILGRPSLIMGYFTLLSLWIVVSNFRTGSQTPVCQNVQVGFMSWILINLVGLIAFKTLPNKIIGLVIMALFYMLSEMIVAMAVSSEITSS